MQTILGIASTYSCASMRTRAEAFIHRHFESVYQGEEFLAMPFEQLVALLRSDSVSVASEETTFRGGCFCCFYGWGAEWSTKWPTDRPASSINPSAHDLLYQRLRAG